MVARLAHLEKVSAACMLRAQSGGFNCTRAVQTVTNANREWWIEPGLDFVVRVFSDVPRRMLDLFFDGRQCGPLNKQLPCWRQEEFAFCFFFSYSEKARSDLLVPIFETQNRQAENAALIEAALAEAQKPNIPNATLDEVILQKTIESEMLNCVFFFSRRFFF